MQNETQTPIPTQMINQDQASNETPIQIELQQDHGLAEGDANIAQQYLGKRNVLTLFLFVLVVIVSQFWFTAFNNLVLDITNSDRLKGWQVLIIAIITTAILYFLIFIVYKIPLVSIT